MATVFGVMAMASASGALQIEVSELPGDNSSLWTFSGSSVVTKIGSNPSFAGNNAVTQGAQGWTNIGDTWSTQSNLNLTTLFTSGTATVSVDDGLGSPITLNLTSFRYGNGIGGFLALATDNDGKFPLGMGDAVSWSGSVVVPIDATDVSSFTSNDFGGMDINFAVVPEPDGDAVVGLAFVGIILLGRRTRFRRGRVAPFGG